MHFFFEFVLHVWALQKKTKEKCVNAQIKGDGKGLGDCWIIIFNNNALCCALICLTETSNMLGTASVVH